MQINIKNFTRKFTKKTKEIQQLIMRLSNSQSTTNQIKENLDSNFPEFFQNTTKIFQKLERIDNSIAKMLLEKSIDKKKSNNYTEIQDISLRENESIFLNSKSFRNELDMMQEIERKNDLIKECKLNRRRIDKKQALFKIKEK